MFGVTPIPFPTQTGQASFICTKPSALAGPAVLATHDIFWHRDGSGKRTKKYFKTKSCQASSTLIACKLNLPEFKASSPRHPCLLKDDLSFSVASRSSFGVQDETMRGIPVLPRRKKSLKPPSAYNDFYKFKYPVLTVKPEWWWRTLACIPYLIGLQISYTGYLFQPFVQRYDFFGDIIFFVPGAITRLPIWFVMVYSYCVYIGVVKNKDWPHYFRFHVVMGMLLELLLQIIWTASNFFPLVHYDGMLGMYYWAIIGVAYIVLTLICVVSALSGNYANIPIISDAAYIHTLFHIGGYQRPF